jgi:hypothetical protein
VVIDVWDHPLGYKARGPGVFQLHKAFDALRFCCLLRQLQVYGNKVARQADVGLTEMYQSLAMAKGPPDFHTWYKGVVPVRS